LLPSSLRLRQLLLSYTVNELGTWLGYVALALSVYDHTHSAIATAGLFIARGLLPALLAPALVARIESSESRGWFARLYLAEAILTAALALLVWQFWLPAVLVLVAADGIAAVAATALMRTAATRIAVSEAEQAGVNAEGDGSSPSSPTARRAAELAQRQASAALNVAFMVTLAIGPALGGLLVRATGGPVALAVDAATFLACCGLLIGLRTHVEEVSAESIRKRLDAAWKHTRAVPQLRTLIATEAVAVVFFAAVEPIEVIYAKRTLSAGDLGFGLLLAVWGAGAALGALMFARSVRRTLGLMLTLGTLLVGVAYLGFAAAPTLVVACCAAFVGGTGNGVQWTAFISAVQGLTPAALHGRLMSAIGSINALCPAIGFALGGTIVALASTRAAMVVAGGVATVATLAFLRLMVRGKLTVDHERDRKGFNESVPNAEMRAPAKTTAS
jgi:MFS family permease